MWAFLTKITEEGGIVAALFAAVVILSVLVSRELWKQNQALHVQLRAIQEKRVEEAKAITERVVQHVESTKHHMAKVSDALDVLINVSRRR